MPRPEDDPRRPGLADRIGLPVFHPMLPADDDYSPQAIEARLYVMFSRFARLVLILVAVFLLFFSVVVIGDAVLGIQNRRTVRAIREAQIDNRKVQNSAVVKIDCNQRKAFREALAELEQSGVIEHGEAYRISPPCPVTPPTGTTTTVP